MKFLLILALVLSRSPSPPVHPRDETEGASSARNTKTEPSSGAKPTEMPLHKSAEDRIADYTLWLTVVTGGLVLLGFIQARQIAREFTSTYRPKLIVREVEYRKKEDASEIHYTIANVGGSRATVIESNATAYNETRGGPLPAVPPYEPKRTVREKIRIAAGESLRPPYKEAPDDLTLTIGETVGDLVQTYIMGYLVYRDDNGLKRRTAFCRRYDPDTKRFQTSSDPDYEYAD